MCFLMDFDNQSGFHLVPSLMLASMSLVFHPGKLGMLVQHNISRKLGGLDIAICIF
jgi:hypothetical protein